MKSPTWDKPVFRPEHVVRESDEEFWIDEKRIKGVVDNSVTVEKFGENSIVTLSIIVKEYKQFYFYQGRKMEYDKTEILKIEMGKQNKDTKECLIDSIIHEQLEAEIMLKSYSDSFYCELHKASDKKRHEYINKKIKEYFEEKGLYYGLV